MQGPDRSVACHCDNGFCGNLGFCHPRENKNTLIIFFRARFFLPSYANGCQKTIIQAILLTFVWEHFWFFAATHINGQLIGLALFVDARNGERDVPFSIGVAYGDRFGARKDVHLLKAKKFIRREQA